MKLAQPQNERNKIGSVLLKKQQASLTKRLM
jgi:hypothetical protein